MVIQRCKFVRWMWVLLAVLVDPAAAASGFGGQASDSQPPNIIFILADDLGWMDLACYGSDLHETPHLDQLAAGGVRFTQAYAMPVCSPTRAAILTGKHAARLHLTVWREASVNRDAMNASSRRKLLPPATALNLDHSQVTIAEALREMGYVTLHVGKWHLGDADHSPETQGFDLNIGGTHWGAPDSFFWPFRGHNTFREYRYVPGLGLGQPGEYLTDRLTDEALKLIDAAGQRPFFLNLWFYNPHTPIEGKPELVEHFRGKLQPGLRHRNPDYAAMVHTLDDNVGRLLAYLDQRGLAERTLVVFMSDNGGYVNSFRDQQVTDNSPLRSGKGSLYEGGIRVPLIARLPGVAAPGTVCEQPVVCTDLFRTFAELTGANPDTAQDGISLLPLLRHPPTALNHRELYFHYPHYYPTTTPVSAIRSSDWKLLYYYEDHRRELYHLGQDLGEKDDLAGGQPQLADELQQRLHEWLEEIGGQLPAANPAFSSTGG